MKLILEVARNIPGARAENVTLNMINSFKRNCHPMKRQGNQLQDIIFRGRGTLGLRFHFIRLRRLRAEHVQLWGCQ